MVTEKSEPGHLNGFCILVYAAAALWSASAALSLSGHGATGFGYRCLAALCGTVLFYRLRRLGWDSTRELLNGWLYRGVPRTVFSVVGAGIVLVLTAILFPHHWQCGKGPTTGMNLKMIGLELDSYKLDHGGRMPPMPDRATLRSALTPCPTYIWHSIEKEDHTSFWINTAVGGLTTDELGEGWENIPFAWTNHLDATRWHLAGRYVCFLDARVRFMSEREWYRIRPRTGQLPIKNHRPRQASQPASQAIHPLISAML